MKTNLQIIFFGWVLSLNSVLTAADKGPLSDEQINKRIQQYRTAEVALIVTDSRGKPLANLPVTVRQVRHKFFFGCNGFEIESFWPTEYDRRFAEIFNYATLPFYWGRYEKVQGKPAFSRLNGQAKWCRKNNITPKGHPLCWHQGEPAWINDKPLEEVQSLLMGRVDREVKSFAGTIDVWDAVNEAVILPTFSYDPSIISKLCGKVGQVELLKEVFDTARKTNPNAFLILNDYEIWGDRYEKLIEQCLNAGVSIDAIGIQSHMHTGCWDKEKVWGYCEKFAKFDKPIHFSEVTIVSGELKSEDDKEWKTVHKDWLSTDEGEKRQAKEAVEFYKLLFSYPAVEAITWWDLSDKKAWLGAPSGLLRKDMSPKPAYDALKRLIKGGWWTGVLWLKTDDKGRVKFHGFLGDYVIESKKGSGKFAVEKKERVEMAVGVK